MTDLSGQIALVTGASRGIGAATARALAGAGAHVVLTARDTASLEKVEEAIFEAGGSATIAPVDLTEPDGIARLATAVGQRWDKLDILVINAAFLPELTSVADIDQASFNKALTVNVLATQALIANFDRMLRQSADGRVIGVTSSVGANPRAFWGAYGSTKAAFDTLLQCYAQETAKLAKLRVALVNPGATRTAMRARAFPGEDAASLKPPEAVAERILALLGEPFETGHRETINQPT
ncbi:SDR family NAD(P)-dependent oxidoreductase [Novosphingobium aquimarinum]|uniref:SDR family NAD(P)-dependent oxidoreductase n=1 Tax=Novosphingobium aquimarinum TaxID=2682494 RepID=UPI0012EC474E|nr:SDR family NAD(P)-dependent oxidoreductase [Novosphingobium aquimarinum]